MAHIWFGTNTPALKTLGMLEWRDADQYEECSRLFEPVRSLTGTPDS